MATSHRSIMDINITESFIERVKSLIAEDGNPDLKLRVFIIGGGCSGFKYGFSFEEKAEEDDTLLEQDGVTILFDPMSLQYLSGSEIDFERSIAGDQFVFRNPNAKSTCGCGSSFSA